jgi:6-pyruvoyltetrahydropterin/6-carboxytetrahydropterin synthase
MYQSTKQYGHEVGLSCAFRQWRAASHCRFVHGYALSFKFTFEASTLDNRNWVIDFGGMKELKEKLQATFDHKTVVAADDPELLWFQQGDCLGLLELVIVDAVGCEKFAELAYNMAFNWLHETKQWGRVKLASVEVAEHGANSAIYHGLRDSFGNLI